MPKVRQGGAARWVRRAGAAQPEYEAGVKDPRNDWQQATVAAAPVQAAAVQQAIAQKRYERGVQKAGTDKWRNKSLSKGSQRYAPGVADGQNDYANAVQPFLDKLASIQLPPRGPKGDPKNYQRVVVIGQALNQLKQAGGGQ